MTADKLRSLFGARATVAAVVAANLICCALLIVWMRGNLKRERVDAEAARVVVRVQDVLWGKIARFAAAGAEREAPEFHGGGRGSGDIRASVIAGDLPLERGFQPLRSGVGELRPILVGTPREMSNHEYALPIAVLLPDRRGEKRYFAGSVGLGDLVAYFKDLSRRGIHCAVTGEGGRLLLGGRPTAIGGAVLSAPGNGRNFPEALANGWSVEVFLENAEDGIPLFPQAAVAVFFLLTSAMVVLLGYGYLRPPVAALETISRSLAEHGEMLPDRLQPHYVAGAVVSRLSRYRLAVEEERRRAEEDCSQRVGEISRKHNELLGHHRVTKKMLQSGRRDDVFEALRGGIADGNGFQGTAIGKVSEDGYLVFPTELDAATGIPIRVPLWTPASLLARIFWSGSNVFYPSPLDLPHVPAEEDLVGTGPVYFIPLLRDLHLRCAEARNCGNRICRNFFATNMKCWLHHLPADRFLPDADPDLFREPLLACLQCGVFPGAALVVVRSLPDGKTVSRENTLPLASLASEALLALEFIGLHEQMKIMAITDGLTGLFNHREFYQALRRELVRARRYRHSLSLLIIDVDDFKQYNDRFGHPAGDQALQRISEILRGCARTTDIIARYGGEEFAVILPESSPGGALMVAERIKTEIGAFSFIKDISFEAKLTVSIGIYTSSAGAVSEDQMVSLADEAAYAAKNSGKNRVVVKAPA